MTFKTHLAQLESDLWGYHLPVPQDVADTFLSVDQKRLICTLNRGAHRFHCAFMPKGDGTRFILINKEIRKKLDLKLGDEVEVSLEPDESKYGMPMPEELGALLEIDDEVNEYFHALTPGKQRNLIYLVSKPKRTETRVKKAVVIVDYLKAARGVLDPKALYAALRENP